MFDDLIAKLEAAIAPDPHMDAEIEAAIIGRRSVPAYRHGIPRFHNPSDVLDCTGLFLHRAPSFTGSLDAALTLVPDNHRWLLDKRPFAKDRADSYRAEVYREGHNYLSDRSDVPTHWGPTPALALCIAAIKARRMA